MPEAPFIERRGAADDELGFDSLRSEAIELLEKVSGQTWTDYNLHDPGITILEQLIYALTDLIYRSDFDVQDYLAEADGDIDLAAQNLLEPAQVLCCRPVTRHDYRKMLLDRVALADNVWFRKKPGGAAGCEGRYRLLVKPARDLDPDQQAGVIDDLYAAYHGARNLCEDLDYDDVEIVDITECRLHGEIEVGSARPPAEILAEVYFVCERRIASSVSITNYDQLVGQSTPLDQLFEGPLTRHGIFLDDAETGRRSEVADAALFELVNSIDGVERIRRLKLEPPAAVPDKDKKSVRAFDLFIPGILDEVDIVLTANDRELPFSMSEVNARYEEFRFKYYSNRSARQNIKMLYQPIEGVSRAFGEYLSIQDHFPANYGVNRHGLPESADTKTRARVRQLKAYLLIFEQLMVNFLANIDNLKQLYSTRIDGGRSYAVQPLKAQQVADLDAVYPRRPAEVFGRIVARFDDFHARKSRLLDYLLALYGERFSQNSLRHFNYYHDRNEIDAVIVDNKIAFLESIVELGRDRGSAPAYRRPTARPGRCGLALRSAMLLGFERRASVSLSAAIRRQKLELRARADYEASRRDSDDFRLQSAESLREDGYRGLEQAPLVPAVSRVSARELRTGLAAIAPLRGGLLSDRLLLDGISIKAYHIAAAGPNRPYRLLFALDDNRYWHLGDFDRRGAAVEAANTLRYFLRRLNRDSEGLHIVEHLLLRPQMPAAAPVAASGEDFFSFRISILFPGWSARCRDPEFRKLATETIWLNAPAQLLPDFCWLDYGDMVEFERLYLGWWRLKTRRGPPTAELDRRAHELVEFLRAHHEPRAQTGSGRGDE